MTGLPSVKEGEAMGLLDAIIWVRNMGLPRMIFESDAKNVVDAVLTSCVDLLEFGCIVQSYKEALRSGSDFSVCFARRQANESAHSLARVSHSYASPHVWVEPPDCVEDTLNLICTNPDHYQ